MSNIRIVLIIFGVTTVAALALLAWAGRPLKHRGEEAGAPAKSTPTYPRCAPPIPGADPLDAHFATACPLEYVPPLPLPALNDFEREMAGDLVIARLADRLANRSNR